MARILITGASGLLGANLALVAAEEGHEVIGVRHARPAPLTGATVIQADLTEAGAARKVVRAARPEAIVHCAAAADVDACERDPAWAMHLNRDMAVQVAYAAREAGARLIHISTDAVFDGRVGGYREQDTPAPVNFYGRSKLAGEQGVHEVDPDALIVRTNFFGWGPRPGRGLAEWFVANLEAGVPCPGFVDVRVTPLLVNQLAGFLLLLLENSLSGVLHLAGRTCVSKFDFGRRLAETFGLNPDLVQPSSVQAAGLFAPRPRHLCLKAETFRNLLGRPMPSLEEGLLEFRRLRSDGYVKRIQAAEGGVIQHEGH